MPKKAKSAKKLGKIVVQSDTDDDDFKKPRKKKGRKIAISDSDDDFDISAKICTSKGKISLLQKAFKKWLIALIVVIAISRILIVIIIEFRFVECDRL